jgi:hypothetical protein
MLSKLASNKMKAIQQLFPLELENKKLALHVVSVMTSQWITSSGT